MAIWEILIILLLIALNGFFAMAELAVVSSRKARLRQMADAGQRGAATALQLAEHPGRFLSTVQIGITLIGIFAGAFGGATIGTIADDFFGGDIPEAWAGTPLGPNDGILVIITMYGGNDGLNTVVPYTNPSYYAKRPNIAIAANRVLPIDGTHGFHPELTYLKSLWDAGKVAVIHGVGYPNPDLSHFTSMAIWMGGRFGGGPNTSGWLGRWLDGQPPATADLAAVSVDTSVPLHMVGVSRRAFGLSPSGTMFGTDLTNADQARL